MVVKKCFFFVALMEKNNYLIVISGFFIDHKVGTVADDFLGGICRSHVAV